MFTIVIPTHDRPQLLRRALQSLVAQTYQDFQVIIVDDAALYVPPFGELAALKGRYTHVIRSGTPGPAASRNMGVALATTPYVLFLDDDDSFEPGHLQALATHLGATPPDSLVFCDFKVQMEDRGTSPPTPLSLRTIPIDAADLQSVYVRNRIPNSCLIFPRTLLAGGVQHDPALPLYEDWDFLLACVQRMPNLRHIPVSSVVIHKTQGEAASNMRRGNREELVVGMTLFLYRKYPSPDEATRHARQTLLTQSGVPFDPAQL